MSEKDQTTPPSAPMARIEESQAQIEQLQRDVMRLIEQSCAAEDNLRRVAGERDAAVAELLEVRAAWQRDVDQAAALLRLTVDRAEEAEKRRDYWRELRHKDRTERARERRAKHVANVVVDRLFFCRIMDVLEAKHDGKPLSIWSNGYEWYAATSREDAISMSREMCGHESDEETEGEGWTEYPGSWVFNGTLDDVTYARLPAVEWCRLAGRGLLWMED